MRARKGRCLLDDGTPQPPLTQSRQHQKRAQQAVLAEEFYSGIAQGLVLRRSEVEEGSDARLYIAEGQVVCLELGGELRQLAAIEPMRIQCAERIDRRV